ncbi:hypothetical protein [Pseudomonas fluorescens]|uniref:hypothetical protein n=1 Tax=Pseudomonas fluorescens TaxID=294 RepID=UPI00123FA765|nr:hypothetical protein [Pseudomonas fluorescens]
MKEFMLSSPSTVVDAVREGVKAFQSTESPSLAESLVRLYGSVLRLVAPARKVLAVIENLRSNKSYCLVPEDQTIIARFFNTVLDFDEALAAIDVDVVDVYQPGLIPALISVTGMDYDIYSYIEDVIAPKFDLNPLQLPPNLAHFLANYSGDSGYCSERQISEMKAKVFGGMSFQWGRFHGNTEAMLPKFAFRESIPIRKGKLDALSKLCESLLEVRNILAITIRENWTLAELAKTKNMSVEVVMGDKYENIQNSTIINRSIVNDALKNVEDQCGTEMAKALESIARAVEESRSVAGGALFESFSKELQKKEPNKSALREFWEGLMKVVPNISTMVEATAKIAVLFA